jgi:superfamily I DNA/RNA helicase
MDGEKTFTLLKDTLKSKQDFELYAAPVRRLVGFAKNAGLGTSLRENTFSNWYHLITYNNIILDDAADEQRLVELAQQTLAKSVAIGREIIDFDDMLYLPLLHNVSFDKKNYIFIDEAQDTNGVQRELLKRMLAPGGNGRLVAVGDPSQAIYGFRGADATAMQQMREEFAMTVMPLNVCYRCSKAVVEEARKYETVL